MSTSLVKDKRGVFGENAVVTRCGNAVLVSEKPQAFCCAIQSGSLYSVIDASCLPVSFLGAAFVKKQDGVRQNNF